MQEVYRSAHTLGKRVQSFDWLRGLAVLFMVQCHALVLLKPELRTSPFCKSLLSLDGLVAPSFIFSAGFSLALVQVRGASAGSRWIRVLKTLRRIGEVLAVATLVNWAWFPLFREPIRFLRVDILHCIGLSLLLALPLLALLAPWPKILRWVALALALTVFAISPLFETTEGFLALFLNHTRDAPFPLLPWAGYVYLGASAGATAALGDLRTLVLWIVMLLLLGAGLWLFMPELFAAYPPHHPWDTNIANAAHRWTKVMGLVLIFLGLEYRLTRATTTLPFKVLSVFGTSSLAAYFFHQMLLFYRLFGHLSFNAFFSDRADWPLYWLLTALLLSMTYGLLWLTDKAYRWVDARLPSLPAPAPVTHSAVSTTHP